MMDMQSAIDRMTDRHRRIAVLVARNDAILADVRKGIDDATIAGRHGVHVKHVVTLRGWL